MARRKLQRFKETAEFPNFFQPTYEELKKGFFLKGKWNSLFFQNNNPIILELAAGKAEYTIAIATSNPNKNVIAIDIKGARMWVGCKYALENNLKNTAFVRIPISLIEYVFDENEVSEIWLTFPDPYPKNAKANKRLTSPEYISRYQKILKKDGLIHLKTDSDILFNYTLKVIEENNFHILIKSEDVYADKISGLVTEVQTYYEKMWLAEQKKIKYLCFKPFSINLNENQNFFEKVIELTKKIPYGRVTTYGTIAKYLGSTYSARMVGWALNSSKYEVPEVPAHRVVNRNGYLTGKKHFSGIDTMKTLLEQEGIKVENDRIVDFEKVFWDPNNLKV